MSLPVTAGFARVTRREFLLGSLVVLLMRPQRKGQDIRYIQDTGAVGNAISANSTSNAVI
jgi:hypothetical protein